MISNRQKLILKAIIESVIDDNRPVGSKELIEKPYLNFSSATIRNDMAELEKLGYLLKLHTSSGRMPSNLGYKYYIENLVISDDECIIHYPTIDKIIEENKNQKLVAIEKIVNWLSETTNATVFTVGNKSSDIKIIKIELVKINDKQIFLLIFTESLNVQSQKIDPKLFENVDFKDAENILKSIEKYLLGRSLREALNILKSEKLNQLLKLTKEQSEIKFILIELLKKIYEQNACLKGESNMFENSTNSNIGLIKKYQKELNEENLFSLLANDKVLSARLGNEIPFMPEANCTIISIPYQVYDTYTGQLALIGAKRMQYKKIIPLIEYVALKLSNLYKNTKEE